MPYLIWGRIDLLQPVCSLKSWLLNLVRPAGMAKHAKIYR